MIGQVLDQRYRVLRRLGEGAMGEVYLVENVDLERREALKILRGSLTSYPDLVGRFRREARAINRLSHPNIVTLYELGALYDGRLYMAMEYAEGSSLATLLKTLGTMPTPRALRILVQLADAIDHAHSRFVVHRDLKPENLVILSGRHDVLKVLDFGIAKIVASEDFETEVLSRVGKMMGTAQYMSPELLRGVTADLRSDIYAVGCIAYELLTGDPPFSGGLHEILQQHLNAAPQPLRARRPDAWIPPELEKLVLRCLEKEPDRRFQTAHDLLHELRRTPGFVEAGGTGPAGRTPVPNVSSFDVEDSTQRIPARAQAALAMELMVTDRISAPVRDTSKARRDLLREIAEALIDLGHGELQPVTALSELHAIDQDMAEINGEAASVEAQMASLDENARRRLGFMRFALGDLRIERSHTGRSAQERAETEAKIEDLQRRLDALRSLRDREVASLSEQGVQLASGRAALEEKALGILVKLERFIDEHWADLRQLGPIQPLLDLLQRTRIDASSQGSARVITLR
jgi:serine/threonine protein kinase